MINFDELKITAGTALQADKWNDLVDRLKLEVPANLDDQEVILTNEEKQRNFHIVAGEYNTATAALNIEVKSDTGNVDKRLASIHEFGMELNGPLKIETNFGYLDMGPKNNDWAHFYTDRDKYYFNKEIRVDSGKVGSYNENLNLCTGGTPRMTVETSGQVGIGTTSPTQQLHVMGNRIRLQRPGTSKFVDIRTDGSANDITSYGGHLYLSCDGSGNMVVVNDQLRITNMPYGDFKNVQWNPTTGVLGYDNSSRRFKENIRDLDDNFEAILLAQPKTYTRPGSPGRQEIGFIAEDFHDLGLYPLVDYDEEGLPESLRYEKMGTYMIPVMRRQEERIEALEGEVKQLNEELVAIRELLGATTGG
ncbi:MAG: tail fiber domain-containing protein [Saprospiraceae bacterium]|nr:tail fiber domain-containing protein [Lewinella sp.]